MGHANGVTLPSARRGAFQAYEDGQHERRRRIEGYEREAVAAKLHEITGARPEPRSLGCLWMGSGAYGIYSYEFLGVKLLMAPAMDPEVDFDDGTPAGRVDAEPWGISPSPHTAS